MSEEFELPTGWIWSTLGELGEVIRGVTYDKAAAQETPADGLVPILRATNIGDQLSFTDLIYVPERYVKAEQLLQLGDIVIAASSGSRHVVGKAAQLSSSWDGSFGAFCFALRPTKRVSAGYLALFMRTSQYRHRVSELSAGININNLRAEHLKTGPIPLAPLAEQERIGAEAEKHLSRLDAAIASLQRVQANVKRYRAAVLKAAGNGSLIGLQDRISFHEGLWPLPPGWRWVKAEEVSEFITKGTTPAANLLHPHTGEVPFIKVYNLTFTGALDFSRDPTFVSRQVHETELKRSIVRPGDVLMNIVGPPLGKVSVVPATYAEWNINQAIARYRPTRGIDPRYLSLVLQNREIIDWAISRSKATAGQFNLTLETARQIPIPLPPEEQQALIVAEVERRLSITDAATSSLTNNLQKAQSLRNAILASAFQGRLVAQDPNDEPASALLERIRQAKASQISPSRGRKPKPKPELAPSPPRLGANHEPPEGAAAYSPGREPRDESAPLIPKPPEGAAALSPRWGSEKYDDPQTRGSRPGLYAAAPSGGSKSTRRPPPPVRAAEPEPEPPEAHFLELDREEQLDILWQALLGKGTLDKDVAIRTAADELRALGLARFQRLRHDGPLYGTIAAGIERGVREGNFDRPRRGHVRAVLSDPKEYTDEVWQQCLLAVTGNEPAEIEETLRAAAAWAREAMGLEFARLREGGVILTGLREALEDEVRAGRIVRRGGRSGGPQTSAHRPSVRRTAILSPGF